jgi:hypothetical protein
VDKGDSQLAADLAEYGYFQPDRPSMPPGGGPGPQPGPPGQPGPSRQPPRRHDRDRPQRSRALLIALPVALLIVVVAVLLVAHPFSHSSGHQAASTGPVPTASGGGAGGSAAASGGPPTGSSASASPSPSATVSEQKAATSVATMLSKSVSDRTDIGNAAKDVAACGPNLTADGSVFNKAASSRKALLASLGTMPGRGSLPAALTGDLTKAWQASITADQAYARWASDEASKICVHNDTADPGAQATAAPNADATKYKTAFAAAWNPVAAKYGLTKYQPGQL